jgi:hypothetical protein
MFTTGKGENHEVNILKGNILQNENNFITLLELDTEYYFHYSELILGQAW